MKQLILTCIAVLLAGSSFAQDGGIEMADVFRSNGHIYVVVLVVTVILLGILWLLFSIDRRVKKLEKK